MRRDAHISSNNHSVSFVVSCKSLLGEKLLRLCSGQVRSYRARLSIVLVRAKIRCIRGCAFYRVLSRKRFPGMMEQGFNCIPLFSKYCEYFSSIRIIQTIVLCLVCFYLSIRAKIEKAELTSLVSFQTVKIPPSQSCFRSNGRFLSAIVIKLN